MTDDHLHAKLDQLIAAQAEHSRRLAGFELVLVQVVQAINGQSAALAPLREAVEKLAEAANKEEGSQELALALKGILDELGKQTSHMAVISVGLERLPGIMEDTAINAVELATGGGAGPRPRP